VPDSPLLGRLLQRMQDQKKSQGKKKGDQKKRSERNKDEFALAKKGKKHFYLKKSVEKAVEVMEKYVRPFSLSFSPLFFFFFLRSCVCVCVCVSTVL